MKPDRATGGTTLVVLFLLLFGTILPAAIRPAAVAAAPRLPAVAIGNGFISVNAVDADIRDVLAMLSQESGLNIVVASDVQGPVTMRLKKVSYVEALQMVCRAGRVQVQQAGAAYMVSLSGLPPASLPGAAGLEEPATPRNVSLSAHNGQLRALVNDLVAQAGVDAIVVGDLRGRATIHVHDQPFARALGILLAGTRYHVARQQGIYLIGELGDAAGGGKK